MTEFPTQNKFEKWKRPINGGALSGLIAGIFILKYFYLGTSYPETLIGAGFLAPFVFLSFFSSTNYVISVFISLLFWILIGAIIAYFIENNKIAFVCWTLLLLISSIITMILPYFLYRD